MSRQAIRNALQAALNGIAPALPTAWENLNFTPPAIPPGQTTPPPYQKVWFIWASPDDGEFGPNYLERGTMQVTLMYPQGTGPAAAEARIALLRSVFHREASFPDSGITTNMKGVPKVGPTEIADGRYAVPVRIAFTASITN